MLYVAFHNYTIERIRVRYTMIFGAHLIGERF